MKYIIVVFAILFSACSVKDYEHTKSKLIIIKSPKIKFSDIGYIRNTDNSVQLELFIAGKVIDRISINHLVCVSDGCMSKGRFNKDYLHPSYPDELLQNILLGAEVYNGKNSVKTDDGFEQNINSDDVDIFYRVKSDSIFFKDRKNKIIFKIKEIK